MTMKKLKYLFLVLVALAVVVVTGCERKGPMQTAGENVDNAARKTGDAVDDAINN
jgi:predicted small lipoprotein YifL